MKAGDARLREIYTLSASVTDPGAPAEVLAEISFHQYDVTSLSVKLHLLGEGDDRVRAYSHVMHLDRNHFWLYAKGLDQQSIEVLGIRGVGSEGWDGTYMSRVLPHATSVQIGISEEKLSEEKKIWMTATLGPSGILIQPAFFSFGPAGEVERSVYVKGRVDIETSLGSLVAIQQSGPPINGDLFGTPAITTASRPVLTGEIVIGAGNSLFAAHETFLKEIHEICALLGFCYRQRVSYYDIRYREASQDGRARAAVYRRNIPPFSVRERENDELINFRDLVRGGFKELQAGLGHTPKRAEILRAVQFLTQAYGREALEVAYILAYASLECAVDAADRKESSLTGSQWSSLRGRLEKEIRSFFDKEPGKKAMRMETAQMAIEKLGEVQRIAIRKRVTRVCRRLKVQIADIWPDPLTFDKGLARATTARNQLVHAALTGDEMYLYGDLVRLRVLTERIILKLLKWPNKKVWRWADQSLLWANKGEKERPVDE